MRLEGYDYSNAGAYFITVCVKDGHQMLGEIVGANCVRPILSPYGRTVEKEILNLPNIYSTVSVAKYIIMPNHVHMIIITANDSGRTQFAPTISRVIKQFKGSITKQIGFSLWQKSFHDHVIRNEADYQRISQYIVENPMHWKTDEYFPK